MKFSIQRKSIRAMLHLAAKKDIRYYLQGINVVRDNRGTYIEATDGHVLGRLLIDGIRSDTKLNVVLPTDALLKLKGTKKQSDEWLHFEVNGLSVECIQGDSTIRFSAHDARFNSFCDCSMFLVDLVKRSKAGRNSSSATPVASEVFNICSSTAAI